MHALYGLASTYRLLEVAVGVLPGMAAHPASGGRANQQCLYTPAPGITGRASRWVKHDREGTAATGMWLHRLNNRRTDKYAICEM